MKELIKYCAFRIASFYKRTRLSSDYLAQGFFLLSFSLTCYLLTIVHVVSCQLGQKLHKIFIIVLCIPLIIEIVRFDDLFPNVRNEFNEFEKERVNEKHKLLKELLIVIFLLFSLISCACFLLHFW